VVRELARYKLDLVVVQKVRCDKEGTVRAGDYKFSVEKEVKIISCDRIFVHQRIASAVKKVEFLVIGCHI
jgi:hypothetical protein